jgi:hypothetical protein
MRPSTGPAPGCLWCLIIVVTKQGSRLRTNDGQGSFVSEVSYFHVMLNTRASAVRQSDLYAEVTCLSTCPSPERPPKGEGSVGVT